MAFLSLGFEWALTPSAAHRERFDAWVPFQFSVLIRLCGFLVIANGALCARLLFACFLLELMRMHLGTRLPQVFVGFGPLLHQTRFPAVRTIANAFFAHFVEEQETLADALGRRRRRQLTAGGVDGLLGGRKADFTWTHFL